MPENKLSDLNSLIKYFCFIVVIEEININFLLLLIKILKNGINKENGGLVIIISDFFKTSIHSKFLKSPLPFNLVFAIPSVVFSYKKDSSSSKYVAYNFLIFNLVKLSLKYFQKLENLGLSQLQ